MSRMHSPYLIQQAKTVSTSEDVMGINPELRGPRRYGNETRNSKTHVQES